MIRTITISAIALFALACSRSETNETAASAPPKSNLPDKFLLAVEPTDAKPVLGAKSSLKSGDHVALTGRVHDFVNGLSAFVITDPSLPSCDESGPMNHCATPWDFCCIDPDEVAKASAMVELRDGDQLLHEGARGFHGLDYLARVTVSGTAQSDANGNLTVVADGVYIRR